MTERLTPEREAELRECPLLEEDQALELFSELAALRAERQEILQRFTGQLAESRKELRRVHELASRAAHFDGCDRHQAMLEVMNHQNLEWTAEYSKLESVNEQLRANREEYWRTHSEEIVAGLRAENERLRADLARTHVALQQEAKYLDGTFTIDSAVIRCVKCRWRNRVHKRELFYDESTGRLPNSYKCPDCGAQLEYDTLDGTRHGSPADPMHHIAGTEHQHPNCMYCRRRIQNGQAPTNPIT